MNEAVDSIKTFHKQQRQLYDGFKLLRSKYDDLKESNSATLWEYIPKKIPKGYDEGELYRLVDQLSNTGEGMRMRNYSASVCWH